MKKIIIFGISLIILFSLLLVADYFNFIPKKSYTNNDFNIKTYHSKLDKDNDSYDDQTDILRSAREYVSKKPIYKSKYYGSGYPDDNFGVCTDVVAFALLNSGYDIRELLNEDVKNNRNVYNIKVIDKNIDFRRVNNVLTYLTRHAISLTTDLKKIEEWQGGDIVVFKKHIAIVSDKRTKSGRPYIIHNAGQKNYEEDAIRHFEIVGHFRIS